MKENVDSLLNYLRIKNVQVIADILTHTHTWDSVVQPVAIC